MLVRNAQKAGKERLMYDTVCYRTPFLKEIIVRLDFVGELTPLTSKIPAKITTAFAKKFPISEPTEAVTQQVTISGDGAPQHSQIRIKQYNFHSKDRSRQLSITRNFIFFKYSRYETYEELRESFNIVATAFSKQFPETQVARFGLRYVNVIDIENTSPVNGWKPYIHRDLLSTLKFLPPKNITRAFHILESKFEDIDIRLQFGIHNPDFPAIVRRPEFILDFDGYVQVFHSIAESVNYMDTTHAHIQSQFERSITPRLREIMNGQPASD